MKKMFGYGATLLVASMMWTTGCGNEDAAEPEDSDNVDKDSNSDEGDGGEKDTNVTVCDDDNTMKPALTECAANPGTTCAELPEGQDNDCVANFNLGTAQAGFRNGSYAHVGWYGYNDHSAGGNMEPPINNTGSEPATCVMSCDKENDYVLHVKGDNGWIGWGAGIGLDWGETPNPYCDEGGLKCLEIFEADPNFKLKTAEADARCHVDGKAENPVDPNRMKCVLYSKNYKEVRDLSAYKGIGFWALVGNKNTKPAIQVGFAIPETTRFITDSTLVEEYRIGEDEDPPRPKSFTYTGGCNDDDTSDSNKCYGDYATTVNLSSEEGIWKYYEVMFDELLPLTWGMPLESQSFPSSRSIGIKFQIDKALAFDYYIDDIRLIRK